MMGPACLHPLLIYKMFYEDDIHPEIQMLPAISAIHPEHLYQQKKSWVPLVISNITGGVDINW